MRITGWTEEPLARFIELITYGFTNPMPTTEAGPYMVTAKDIRNGTINYASARHTSPDDYHKLTAKSRPLKGDVLLTKDGSIGRVAVCDRDDVCINQSVALIRPSNRILPTFLSYLLQSPKYQRQMESDSDGSTIKHIYITRVDKMPILVPPLPEQQAIAEVLGALDDKIAANRKLTRTADDLLAAEFGRTTLGVQSLPLREVATVNDQSVKPRPGKFLRYIDISSVDAGTYNVPGLMTWEDAPSRARRHVTSGDTVWSTVRPNRRSHALILDDSSLLVASTGLAVLRPRDVGFAFLYEATNTPAFTSYLENVAEGSAYPAVNGKRFLDARIPWPSSAARARFERLAASIRTSVHGQNLENLKLAEIRDALLPQLMSGKLRVNDAESIIENAI